MATLVPTLGPLAGRPGREAYSTSTEAEQIAGDKAILPQGDLL